MTNVKWTENQQKAIELRGKNMLVSAAAGSGKTAVLVERIKQLIIEDGIPLEQMLIVTFSNAAASEMREKIIRAVSDAIESGNGTAEREQFLRNQLNSVHKANISTFHAFSMEVIRRYFYLIDIDPNFKICDEAQKTILQAEAMDELFAQKFQEKDESFLCFLRQYAGSKNEDAVKTMIGDTHRFIQSLPEPFKWLKAEVESLGCSEQEFCRTAVFREIMREVSYNLVQAERALLRTEELLDGAGISSLLPKCAEDIRMVSEARAEAEAFLNALNERGDAAENDSAGSDIAERFHNLCTAVFSIRFAVFRASKAENEAYGEVKEAVKVLRDRGKSLVKKIGEQYLSQPLTETVRILNMTKGPAECLFDLTLEFDQIYRRKKKSRGVIDFSDIEHEALQILSDAHAAAEYREKFKAIFIDEYQDSNIVQETLIGKIKGDHNLFMVGDVKQSIYKFRLAEPEIFIEKYEAYKRSSKEAESGGQEGKDQRLDLNMNFRSKAGVITAVNGFFSQIMKKDTAGLDYDEDAALYRGVNYDGELAYGAELHLIDDRQIESEELDGLELDDEIREMKKAELEAFTAAQMIKEARGMRIFDGKAGKERALNYRDIVILLRSTKGYAECYCEALTQEGIPAFMDSGDGYFDTVEIEVFLNLLRIIDNRRQDIPLLSVLRSAIFGFTTEELVEIRLYKRKCAYSEAFLTFAEDSITGGTPLGQKCAAVLKRLKSWRWEASFLPLEEFLWKLISSTDYFEYIGAIPGGGQRQANLRALVDKAIAFHSAQMKGLFGFIHYIEALQKGKVSTGQVKLLSENDDVVRIMTVHKSKGLEFPFVLVGGLGKRFNKDSGSYKVSLHKDVGMGLRAVEPEKSCYRKTILQTVIEQKKAKEGMAEEIRILYVAMTRAMDKLTLLGTVTNILSSMERWDLMESGDTGDAKSYLDLLMPAYQEGTAKLVFHDRGEVNLKKADESFRKEELREGLEDGFLVEESEESRQRQNLISSRLEWAYPYGNSLQIKSKFTVSELKKLDGVVSQEVKWNQEEAVPRFCQEETKLSGAERGTILHRIMEHLNFREMGQKLTECGSGAADGVIREFVTGMVKRGLLSEKEAETVECEKIEGFFRSEIGRRASKATRIFKEASFNLKREIPETIIIQGTIDCYFEEAGAYILLDYKSDFILPDSFRKDMSAESAGLDELVRRYRPQVALYKEALEKIKKTPVREVYLYSFSLGREVRIELD